MTIGNKPAREVSRSTSRTTSAKKAEIIRRRGYLARVHKKGQYYIVFQGPKRKKPYGSTGTTSSTKRRKSSTRKSSSRKKSSTSSSKKTKCKVAPKKSFSLSNKNYTRRGRKIYKTAAEVKKALATLRKKYPSARAKSLGRGCGSVVGTRGRKKAS